MLRLALYERWRAADELGFSVGTWPSELTTGGTGKIRDGFTKAFDKVLFDTANDTLIELYVDSDSGTANYTDESSFPTWTKATLESALSITIQDRWNDGVGSANRPYLASWALNRYKILNELIWILDNSDHIDFDNDSGFQDEKAASDTDWDDCKTAWAAASWVPNLGNGDYSDFRAIAESYQYASGTYSIRRQRLRIPFTASTTDSFSVDLYAKLGAISANYEDNDYGADEDTYGFISQASESNSWSGTVGVVGDKSTVPRTNAPGVSTGYGWQAYQVGFGGDSWYRDDCRLICRFDGPNGFAFTA